jgi:hypothetical protein
VTGLALSPNTAVYYYTYGSVLAALSRPKAGANNCNEALKVLGEVKTAFGADRDIAAIVAEGELICASIGTGAGSTNGAQPQVTVAPRLILETPTPTASP